MSRKNISNHSNPSLFPFLSILTCTIGALALMITLGLVYGDPLAKGNDDNENKVNFYEQYVKVNSEVKQTKDTIKEHQQWIAQAEALRQKLNEMKQEYDRLQKQQTDSTKTAAELGRLLSDIAELRKARAKLENELNALLKANADKEKERNNMPAPGTVRIIPPMGYAGTDGRENKLTVLAFVECHRNNIIIYPYGGNLLKEVSNDDIESSSEIDKLIKDAADKSSQDELIVLLLRSDGVKSFDKLLNRIKENNDDEEKSKVRYGEVLIPGSGTLDLSEFKKSQVPE